MVGYVVPDGAAAKAGIHEGDQWCRSTTPSIPPGKTSDEGNGQRAAMPVRSGSCATASASMFTVTPVLDENRRRIRGLGRAERNRGRRACCTDRRRGQGRARSRATFWSASTASRSAPRPRLHEIDQQQRRQAGGSSCIRATASCMTVTVTPARCRENGRDSRVDDRRAAGSRTSNSSACRFRRRCHESVRQNAKNAKLIFQFLRRDCRAAHVAEVARRPHRHRADVGRGGARRPDRRSSA